MMLRGHMDHALAAYVRDVETAIPGQVDAVYAVGSLALDDFSSRQSNVDLVVVSEKPLELTGGDGGAARRVGAAERLLHHAGRRPAIWYATWDELASEEEEERSDTGSAIATPMTRALLRDDAIAIAGPDWPVVWFDEDEFRAWCRQQLRSLVSGDKGMLVLRRVVSPMILDAARLGYGALNGKVVSKSAAAEAIRPALPTHFRRILTDSAGYRQGAQTSMYWGPFERKYDALRFLERLEETLEKA